MKILRPSSGLSRGVGGVGDGACCGSVESRASSGLSAVGAVVSTGIELMRDRPDGW